MPIHRNINHEKPPIKTRKETEMAVKEKLADVGTKEWHEQIMGAVARGWCSSANEHKTMDPDLAMAITSEIEDLLRTDRHLRLGCATTRELLDEITARIDVGSVGLDYRTVDEE